MPSRELVLTNKRGLHARAATKLVNCCAPFEATVMVSHGERRANAANVMALLMLAAPCGTALIIDVEGEQADEALSAIESLFEARFEEEE
ncbi:HPr family phosphocarrier protein [Cobetia marina]|jgi:phosphocarrier protein NPr|uniref:HPr family phosphocarrier protein n=1 Tax=Cobetia marina TaxID=28258 RepID=A0ABU9GJA3_COBMA|nr:MULTISPECIES: HPr family phosphocarrier protein [Cobetia]AOM02157.1 phosphate ABC transporter permease [Cobetia marina]AZV31990.1 HPr family phosphocarrier protein [Cobetia sp. ICG0124]MDA5563603.1 HPr family phosphocarrier protein [Cobetia sp. MMG027]MDH2290711.1 HPr family phosphocarrier protein [Cobetia sp. 10Alg 146]MDH2372638.1 HPr family phosphocarrier protein [Cobetia sp. 3AK]